MNIWKIIGIVFGAAALGAGGLAAANPGNTARTSPDDRNEKLRTRKYPVALKEFADKTRNLIPTLSTYGKKWKFTDCRERIDEIEINAEVPVVVFTDDLKITAKQISANEITVDIQSASRVGNSDLGENRRHIVQVLTALDAKFGGKN